MLTTGWTIVGRYGPYYGAFRRTRKDAIQDHCRSLGHTWKTCRDYGDRAVRAALLTESAGDTPEGE